MKRSRKQKEELPSPEPQNGDTNPRKNKSADSFLKPDSESQKKREVVVDDTKELKQKSKLNQKKKKRKQEVEKNEGMEDTLTEEEEFVVAEEKPYKKDEDETLIPLQKLKPTNFTVLKKSTLLPKSTVLSKAENGRKYTVSMAVAGSIVDNAQSLELATSLAGQIGRAAAIFQVDEIVVFDEGDEASGPGKQRRWRDKDNESGGVFLARILQYLDTPQYLRHSLIPMHSDLRFAGRLPPLDAPHHARAHEWPLYREGCVVNVGESGEEGKGKQTEGSLVNVGLQKEVRVRQKLDVGNRVTVAMGVNRDEALKPGSILEAVSPSEPREKTGSYWGFTVRLVQGVGRVFSDCPFQGGYDFVLGTSEHGEKIRNVDLVLPPFRHLLVVFGGVAGLEESVELDGGIEVKDTPSLFHRYLNTCPSQGSRTIRTEEAVLISMSFFQDAIWRSTGQSPF